MNIETWRNLAEELADCARPILRKYFRQRLAIDDKADDSPVTIADREAEAAMRKILQSRAKGHGIIGEEYGKENEGADYVWVMDPIDGTKSFITGRPLFGTLIALLKEGKPILGIIDMPILDERWVGLSGAPTLLNSKAVQSRSCGHLSEAYLSAASPHMFAEGAAQVNFDRVRRACKLTTYNGDCYMYAMVATGFLDLIIEQGLGTYDYMALIPILEGAGATITDWQGQPLGLHSIGEVIAAGDPKLHELALDKLQS